MNKTAVQELDFTEGSIIKKMLIFSLPIFAANLLQSSYQIIDSLWVGNLLGAYSLGAISISATVIFTILSFIIGINNATLTVLSQYRGAENEDGMKRALNAFVVVLGILTVFVGAVGLIISGPILKLMGAPEGLFADAKSYLQVNFLGIIFLFSYNFIGTVLRALGNSRAPLRFVIVAVVLNTILDPLFIAGFGLGIEGAAIATIVSQGIAFLYGLYYSIKIAKVPFSLPFLPHKDELMKIFRLGLPSGLSMMVISGGTMAIMSVVASYGEEVVAGFGAAQRIDSLLILPSMTLGTAVTSMAGQNIGAKAWERVSQIAKTGIMFIAIVAFSISVIAFIGASFFIGLFVNDAETIAFGAIYLRTVAFFYPFLGVNFVLNGVVRASGAMFQVLVLNIISFWVLRYPLTYMFSKWYGEIGIGIGMSSSLVISSIIAASYYKFGKWRNIKVIDS